MYPQIKFKDIFQGIYGNWSDQITVKYANSILGSFTFYGFENAVDWCFFIVG